MTKFKIKAIEGSKYNSILIKWQGQKLYLNEEMEYDSDKLNIPYEEIKKQIRKFYIRDAIKLKTKKWQ